MIEVQNVSMHFPIQKSLRQNIINPFQGKTKFTAIANLNLKINEGDKVAFLGLNGAGKTTLLKLIGGLLYPTVGTITVNNFNTVSENLKARKTVGFVLNEERSFYWRLTGIQNLEFFGVLDNLGSTELKVKIKQLIKLVGLEGAQHKLVATYSSGMKQRLAIARGLLCDPQILILDEPTRTLDPEAVRDIKKLINQKIHEYSQRTLLIATHRFDEVEELCNKVCIMRNGELLSYCTIDEIRSNYQNISTYYNFIIKNGEQFNDLY